MDEDTRGIVPVESIARTDVGAAAEGAVRPAEQLVADVAKVMDLIAERLELETPHPATARRVRGARTVPREFVVSMIAAAERRPDFLFLGAFDSAEARSVLESSDAYRMLAERTAMLLASLNYTIEARWANVVAGAMYAFSQASIVAKRPEQAELAAEIENLRRQLGRKGLRRKKAAKKAAEPE
ncbi:MAG: hypothetical protein JWO56_3063 [Acidobacteria bacterium]|nr:hypothetical protein [Acidobacteriota bacterium]